jgi:hypothetical protein
MAKQTKIFKYIKNIEETRTIKIRKKVVTVQL